MGRLLVALAGCLALLLGPAGTALGYHPATTAQTTTGPEPPEVSAASWILYDETFDRVLAAHEPRQRRAIASTTKMMTALVVIRHAGLGELVTISQQAADVGEAEIDLVAGEQITVGDLLAAILIGSANDAAMALAEHVGGSVEGFVDLMNREAITLGLEDTHFVNPHGLDDPAHYSSAADLLVLGRTLMQDPVLAELVRSRRHPFPESPNGRVRVARATNELLRTYPGTVGIKTGYTDQAGLTLVAAAERDDRRLYAVVLGSEDHFADAVQLLEFGFGAFGPTEVLRGGTAYAQRRSPDGTDSLRASEGATRFMSVEEAERVVLELRLEHEEPVVVAVLDDEVVARSAMEPVAPEALPDLREAAAWASIYWDRLWGRSS